MTATGQGCHAGITAILPSAKLCADSIIAACIITAQPPQRPLATRILSCRIGGGIATSARKHFAVLVKILICAALIGALAATPATIFESTVRGVVDISGMNGFIAIINNDSPDTLGRLRVVNNAVRPLTPDPSDTVGLNIAANHILTDAEVSGTTGTVIKQVHTNTVGGTLSCIGNEPPFVGCFNTAATLEGQCTGPA